MAETDESLRKLRELRAHAHPVRLRILSLLTGSALTAAEVGRELGMTHANASYHLRQLLAAGIIQVVGEERIRGGTAKRYRYDLDRDLELTGVPRTDSVHSGPRRQVYAAFAQELRRRGARVASTPNRAHATDAELWVDPALWEELKSTVDDVADRLHRAARPARTPGTILVSATYVMFEMRP